MTERSLAIAVFLGGTLTLGCAAVPRANAAERPFVIRVVDEATGRGVPLVELSTTNGIALWTDSNGIAVFDEPGLVGQSVFFSVRSHGYEYPEDGFGYRGKALLVKRGASATLRVRRTQIAERLYRVTGAGIYRDSVLAGISVPIRRSLVNARVVGQDSVLTAIYRGRIHWFWGDTSRVRYPLGNFFTTGATSHFPARGGLDPAVGVDLEYFENDEGFVRPMAKFPGPGPTWLSGLVVLGEAPNERMFAHYERIESGVIRAYERGLVEFSGDENEFSIVSKFEHAQPFPGGAHTLVLAREGVPYVYFCDPLPLVRVRADAQSLAEQSAYESYSPLVEGERDAKTAPLDRSEGGELRFAWKRGTAPLLPATLHDRIRKGDLREDESPYALRDVEAGKTVAAHRGTVEWNAHRRRWVCVFVEVGGTSFLGEVWYAEADRILGPWVWARKIATHDRYSFYNPRHHPFFDAEGGRIIYFEGTYATTFSGNSTKTPRYDYNQILYRLDLDDPRLNLPVAVYETTSSDGQLALGDHSSEAATADEERAIAFWAFERPGADTVPIRLSLARGGAMVYGYSPGAEERPSATVPLWEFTRASDDGRRYATDDRRPDGATWKRGGEPVGYVWPHAGRRTAPR